MWASRFNSWTRISCEPHISTLGRRPHVLGSVFGLQLLNADPNTERMFPLSHLQHMSVRRLMDYELNKFLSGVSLGNIGANAAYPASHGREIIGLQLGLVRTEYPTGETPQWAATFINQFIVVMGNFPWWIPCDKMDSLYREAMVVKNGELRLCTIWKLVMTSGFIWGRQGRHAWHHTKQASPLCRLGAL